MDQNGDGIGDIQGIISKLDYLQDLGINLIWICPMYPSPNEDNGYDISNYQGIMKEFGTMDDFEKLLIEIHQRKMKLIMDLIINHTSDEHPWFIESRSAKCSPYRDFYIWRKGKNGKEPNNWASIFGGSAWEYDSLSHEYYLHIFSRRQPDLNWENPSVRKGLYSMINWWLEKGIDGFRVDAISHIKKEPGFPDLPNPKKLRYVPSYSGHMNRKGIHEYLQELNRETFSKYPILTVGEANGVSAEEAGKWVGEKDGIFNMIFQFEHLDLWGKGTTRGCDLPALKQTLSKWQKELDGIGWNALFIENHDQPRSVSIMGNTDRYHGLSAKCLAVLYFLMQGTPFIYQGQEIGMTNVQFSAIEDYRDVATKNLYKEEIGLGMCHDKVMEMIWKSSRDNARTPMQWSNEKHAGFTSGMPWIKVNSNYKAINAASAIQDPTSVYHFYKKLIALRRQHKGLIYGKYDLLLKKHKQIFAYLRSTEKEQYLIIANPFPKKAVFYFPRRMKKRKKELLLCNYEPTTNKGISIALRPYEARVYHFKKR